MLRGKKTKKEKELSVEKTSITRPGPAQLTHWIHFPNNHFFSFFFFFLDLNFGDMSLFHIFQSSKATTTTRYFASFFDVGEEWADMVQSQQQAKKKKMIEKKRKRNFFKQFPAQLQLESQVPRARP